AITSCVFSSKKTLYPVCTAALVMMFAIEWLYPASTGAFGVFRLRTHSIQLRIWLEVSRSPPVFAEATTGSTSDKLNSGNRLGCMCISSANFFVNPPVGDTLLVIR